MILNMRLAERLLSEGKADNKKIDKDVIVGV